MKKYIQIITTTNSKENAEKIANALVTNRLAACVQIISPVTSVYWWKEKVERTAEWLCIAKTRRDMYKAVEQSIRSNHTYEIPEILAIPVVEGSESYFSWLDKEIKS